MKNIAVFASGNGSNFQAILDAVNDQRLNADIKLLVCDQPGAFVTERAKRSGVDVFEFLAKNYPDKEKYEQEILIKLKELQVEWVVLAGYMRLIGKTLLSSYEGRIINIHPSLLPAFSGKDAIGQALAAKVAASGVTVHFVDEGMDTGPIIAQETVELGENESDESFQAKIHKVEHKLYPQVLQMLFSSSRGNEK